MSEYERAAALANAILDRINADPDDDLAVLSRQLLRAQEALKNLTEAAESVCRANNFTEAQQAVCVLNTLLYHQGKAIAALQ